MKKSDTYYLVRSLVRGTVMTLMILAVLVIVHMAAASFWSAALFAVVVLTGVAFYDLRQTAKVQAETNVQEEQEVLSSLAS